MDRNVQIILEDQNAVGITAEAAGTPQPVRENGRKRPQSQWTDEQKEWLEWRRRILRLPSVETQTLEWFQFDLAFHQRAPGWPDTKMDLIRRGFRLYVRGLVLPHKTRKLWTFTIAKIEIPESVQGRGWLTNYLNLVWHTMPHEALMLEQVHHERLFQHFACRRDYESIFDHSFIRVRPVVSPQKPA